MECPYSKLPPDRDGAWTVRICDEIFDPRNSFLSLCSDRKGFATGYFEALRNLMPAPPRSYWTVLCAPDGTVKASLPPTPPCKPSPQGDPIAWLHMDQVTVRLMLGGQHREVTVNTGRGLSEALYQGAAMVLADEMAHPLQ